MAEAEKVRRDLEKQALTRFIEVASNYTNNFYTGQGDNNRIAKQGKKNQSYFQRGDLSVDTPSRWIIVEVESAGGTTNLVKYWYCLENNFIAKPIYLLHIFAQVSDEDYLSHMNLWEFLKDKMQSALGNKFSGKKYTYRNLAELETVVGEFEQILRENLCVTGPALN